jgi:hypothetical protein
MATTSGECSPENGATCVHSGSGSATATRRTRMGDALDSWFESVERDHAAAVASGGLGVPAS